ncbi:MAG TPA: presqualene diphosphate synthase HpnD, partial [Candidatus Polarisedimenticolia bacterium]|nr:presqualene diphosphate synthase HpnD [Candidatus Polarisedimenticolia bacterium]
MKLLPPEQRDAMYEIYAFCRAVDDIADDGGPKAPRREQLAGWREDIDAIYRGAAPAKLAGLAKAQRQFDLRREDFHAVIDGMAMDLEQDIRAPDLATLDLYCDRVASAVGRLSVRVFGMEWDAGERLAHHLGRALQLTNILRDIDEDAVIGRLYLPAEFLQQAGIVATEPGTALADTNIGRACAPLADKAGGHFLEAHKIMAAAPRRLTKAPRVMGAVYRRILLGLTARGWAAPRQPVKVSKVTL